ncbi:MAG: TraR/DksA C4-type zinc finger protein [Candidatus Doudnabacteria bacterium]|nr:TraR/DksA C4-type zinc finger protein [Candidatus Doudnabacteria bacterium]
MLNKEFIEEMKQQLLAAKQKLQNDLAGLNPHEELGADIDSNAQEVEDDEVSQDMIARVTLDLEKIDKALEKIENGTYGIGVDGKEISEDRLRAIPWADKAI